MGKKYEWDDVLVYSDSNSNDDDPELVSGVLELRGGYTHTLVLPEGFSREVRYAQWANPQRLAHEELKSWVNAMDARIQADAADRIKVESALIKATSGRGYRRYEKAMGRRK